MKAARLLGPNNIRIMDVDTPKPGSREVLIKVRNVGICGTDYSIYSGESSFVKNGSVRFPMTLGHEWSGVVAEIGNEVKNLRIGDRVVGDANVSCGICYECLCGRYVNCENVRCVGTLNAWDGAYADYILMPERHVYKIADNVSFEDAALVEPAATALYAVQRGGVRPGDVVLVEGTGPIGLSAVQLSRLAGASCVILSGRKDFKLNVGKMMGADFTVNILKEDLKEKVMAITDGKGAQVIIEASGAQDAVHSSLDIIRPGGVISMVAFYDKPFEGLNLDNFIFKDCKIVGVAGSPGTSVTILELMKHGKVDFKPLITHRYPFKDVVSALEDMKFKNDRRIKIMLEL